MQNCSKYFHFPDLDDTAVEVLEKICNKRGVAKIGEVIKCDRTSSCQLETKTCSSTSCSLHCNGVSSCQVMTAHESTWMIECSETSACGSLKATCSEGTVFHRVVLEIFCPLKVHIF